MVAVFFLVTLHHQSNAHPYPLPRGRGTWKGQRTNADEHGQKKEVRESPMQEKNFVSLRLCVLKKNQAY